MPEVEAGIAKMLKVSKPEARVFLRNFRVVLGPRLAEVWIAGCLEKSPDGRGAPVATSEGPRRVSSPWGQQGGSRLHKAERLDANKRKVPHNRYAAVRRLPMCPHGVPKTALCAICDPGRFAMLADPD